MQTVRTHRLGTASSRLEQRDGTRELVVAAQTRVMDRRDQRVSIEPCQSCERLGAIPTGETSIAGKPFLRRVQSFIAPRLL